MKSSRSWRLWLALALLLISLALLVMASLPVEHVSLVLPFPTVQLNGLP
jgi:hypothetical protein